jgi:hypothetical protein
MLLAAGDLIQRSAHFTSGSDAAPVESLAPPRLDNKNFI